METTPSPLHPLISSSNSQSKTDTVRFDSATGSKSSQKLDPFAEQNAKRTEQKKGKNRRRKTIIIVTLLIAGLVAIGIIVYLMVVLIQSQSPSEPDVDIPTVDDGSTEQLLNLQDEAQKIYNANASNSQAERLAKAVKVFEDAIAQPNAKDYIDQIQLSKVMFYFINGYNTLAIKTISEINPDKLPNDQKAMFYNTANNAYAQNNDIEKSQEYQKLQTETIIQMGGGQG